jgi:hypothetical protein
MRFQPRTKSSGCQNGAMAWTSPVRWRGWWRYQTSLKARTDSRFRAWLGIHGGALTNTVGS